jgi:hypothetical protein
MVCVDQPSQDVFLIRVDFVYDSIPSFLDLKACMQR